jgi:hypothetical protein
MRGADQEYNPSGSNDTCLSHPLERTGQAPAQLSIRYLAMTMADPLALAFARQGHKAARRKNQDSAQHKQHQGSPLGNGGLRGSLMFRGSALGRLVVHRRARFSLKKRGVDSELGSPSKTVTEIELPTVFSSVIA